MTKKMTSVVAAACALLATGAFGVQYSRSALFPGFDGKWCKIQPSVASDGKGTALMTYQMLYLAGSDVFSGQFIAKSTDGGETWGSPVKIPESADVYERGLRVARYVNVHYSSANRRWFATGNAAMYEGNRSPYHKYVDGKPYGYSVQADVDAESGTVMNYRLLPFPLQCQGYWRFGQFVECENGDLLMPFYFHPIGEDRRCQAVVVRYRFGKDGLEVVEAGAPIADASYRRGIVEPSLVKFRGKYYLTLRTDECGIWAESDDGLHFGKPVKWAWADGTPIGNANTQQHWVPLDGRLHLAYTRVTPTNGHVFRNRAPIFLAEFDPERRCLLRETEQAVVPERGARLGNFVVAPGRGSDMWLMTAEWMQPVGCEKYGSDNSLWLVRFHSDGGNGQAGAEPGFVPIFNGRDLSGWEGATNTYTVTGDGLLTCVQSGGTGESGAKNLWTTRDYTNFVVRFDVKLPPNANNGLGIRTPPNGWCSREGIEIQLLDDRGGMYTNPDGSRRLQDVHYTGAVYGIVAPKFRPNGDSFLNQTNEWNSVEVTANGSRIKVVLNGTTIVDADVAGYSEYGINPADLIRRPGLHNAAGRLHWCGHGHNVFWRNIRIKELPATEPPAPPRTVVASSFGWNAEDATKCLQAALDSGAPRVVVDRQPSEWLVDTIMVPSNVEVVFADGVVVRAKPGSMVSRTDCLFRVRDATNVVMRGEGRAVLRMNRRDYQTRKDVYEHSEHRHLLGLRDACNVAVLDLTLEESGGDGVYLLRDRNVLLDNLYCRGHHRQGTSLITGDNIRISNCTFAETMGTLPECGMDIEPGRPSFGVGKVVVDNCTFCSNRCTGVAINVGSLQESSGRMDVTYSRCRMFDNYQRGLWTTFSHGEATPVKGSLRFIDCRMWGNGNGVMQLSNLESDSLVVSFKRCRFDASGMRDRREPIVLTNGGVPSDLNNLSFERCELVNAPKGVSPVSFGAMTGVGVLPGGAKGVMAVVYDDGTKGEFDFGTLEKNYPPQPELRKFEMAPPIDVKKLVPANPSGRAATAPKVGIWRGPFSFLQHTSGPGSYPVRFVSTQNKKGTVAVQVEVFDPYGTPHDAFTVTEQDFTYQLKTRSKGAIYRFDVKPSGSLVQLSSELPGQGYVARDRVRWLTGAGQNLYFQARPGAGDVKVELTMPHGEWVSAELYAPDGRMVDKCVKSDAGVILVGKRAADAPSEIWRMHVTRFFDDCSIRLGGATTGIYAHDPELLLIVK